MSTLNITYCDICNDEIKLDTSNYNHLSYTIYSKDGNTLLYDQEMDICQKCFDKHILPLKRINNV